LQHLKKVHEATVQAIHRTHLRKRIRLALIKRFLKQFKIVFFRNLQEQKHCYWALIRYR